VTVGGKGLTIRDTDGTMRTVRATHGIMCVLQLRHVAALKHHFPFTNFHSVTVPRGRYRLVEYKASVQKTLWLPRAALDTKLVRRYRAEQRTATRIRMRRSLRAESGQLGETAPIVDSGLVEGGLGR
jgi:hypothetical protein